MGSCSTGLRGTGRCSWPPVYEYYHTVLRINTSACTAAGACVERWRIFLERDGMAKVQRSYQAYHSFIIIIRILLIFWCVCKSIELHIF